MSVRPAAGSTDGAVKVWDTRVPDPVADMSPDDSAAARDCWAVAFGEFWRKIDYFILLLLFIFSFLPPL